MRKAVESSLLPFSGNVAPGEDDWPYLYLESRRVPRLYLVVILVLLVLGTLLLRAQVGGLRRLDPHFLLLGAGFLLLEVQAISRMALIFGTTWIVNSVVITAVLVMILLSNLTAAKWACPHWLGYLALSASLVLNIVFPLDALLALPPVSKAVVSGTLMSLPIYFAGLIFIDTFRRSEQAAVALGSNLFGSLVGGLCESASFVVGIKALGFIALIFYLGSFLSLRRRLSF